MTTMGWYKLKTFIVQTINSAYKGISVFYRDKVSVYAIDMKHHRLNRWDTARGCDYWYWSGTSQLGHMHISPMWHHKRKSFKRVCLQKKRNRKKVSGCLWRWDDLYSSCSSDKVKWRLRSRFLWAEVELCCMRPCLRAAPFLETWPPRLTGHKHQDAH